MNQRHGTQRERPAATNEGKRMNKKMSDGSNSVAQLHGLAKKIHDEHSAPRAAMATGLEHAIKAGKFLQEAKSIVEHGEWLPWLKKNCAFSERTAQCYMRTARECPKLDQEKAQRVADLSFREALKAIASDSSALAKIQDDDQGALIEKAERGELNIRRTSKMLAAQQKNRETMDFREDIRPPDPKGRKVQIEVRADDKIIRVTIGPNEAGLKLSDRVAALEMSDHYAIMRADIEEGHARAQELRAEADQIEARAKADIGLMQAKIRYELLEKHEPAYTHAETIDYQVLDDGLYERLVSKEEIKTPEAMAEFLTSGRGGGQIEESERGYWGDFKLQPYTATKMMPTSNMNGWTRIGAPGEA